MELGRIIGQKESVRESTRPAVLWPRVAKGAPFYRFADNNAGPRPGSVAPGGARLEGRGAVTKPASQYHPFSVKHLKYRPFSGIRFCITPERVTSSTFRFSVRSEGQDGALAHHLRRARTQRSPG